MQAGIFFPNVEKNPQTQLLTPNPNLAPPTKSFPGRGPDNLLVPLLVPPCPPGPQSPVPQVPTCMVMLFSDVGTHSRASSLQQPAHRIRGTQDGLKIYSISSGYSWKMSTRVSIGRQ